MQTVRTRTTALRRVPQRRILRRLGTFAVVTALVATMTTVLSLTVAPPAAAAPALLCDQNTVYGLGSDNVLTAINVNTGATTPVISMSPTNNALGLTNNGIDAWGWQSNSSSSTVAHYNTVTGAVQTFAGVDTNAPSTMIRGAINPATGVYYYGSSGADAYLGAYDTGSVSGTPGPIGRVGSISGLQANANGDFAFSSQGLLFVVTGNQIRRVDDTTPPTTAGNQTLTTTLVATLDDSVNSPGITFASSGYLYVTSGSTLLKLDPANGTIQNTVSIAGGYSANDLGSCTYPNTIVARADITARAFPTDQFTLTVTGGNIIANNTATTSGTATGPQPATAGAVLVLPGSTYTATETAAGTTVLSNYTSSYRCRNNTTGVDALPAGSGTTASFPFPSPTTSAGVDISCVFTSVAKPALTIGVALGGSRVSNSDQFTTAVRTGSATGPVVNATTNSTTTGTGSTVTTGTGTTGRYVGAAGTTYYVTDAAAGTTNLGLYTRTITCTDANGLQTGLPTAAAFTGSLAITVVDGAQISCTVTVTRAPATLTVVAALGSPRVTDADQFTPAIRTGSAVGPVVNSTTASTTTGTGSTVTAGTGTTGVYAPTVGTPYYLTEGIAGPGAALYTRTIACVDSNSVQTGLPSGTFSNPSITPVSGANIVCTITATGTPAALSLTKTNPTQLIVGIPAAYTLTATNSGGTAAATARILDRLPANVQYTSASGTGWSCTASGAAATGQLVDCAYSGSIAPLGTTTLTLTVTPLAGAAGTSTRNTASIGVTPGATPVDPGTCTATGTPAGCAVAPATPVRLVTATDDTATTTPGTTVTTAVLATDTVTPDGSLNPASVTVTTAPGHGTTTVNPATGAVSYTPTTGFSGTDTYRYQVCDSSTPTPICASATVTVTVPNTVTAGADSATTGQNTAVPVAVLSTDTVSVNGSPLNPGSVTVTSGPAHGTTTVNPTTGVVTYTPASGYAGADSFVYRVCDGSIPTPVCASATVTVGVTANTVTAGPAGAETVPGTPVSIDVLGGATSGTGQPLANPTVTAGPGHGTTAVDPETGEITYTPTDGFSGVDTFTYRVCDTSTPTPVCASALVTVTVPNTVTAVADTATTVPLIPVTTDVLRNDTVSTDGASLNPASVTVTVPAAHGITAVNPETGAVTYTPDDDFSGVDSYGYRACDSSIPTPVCASATVTLTVATVVVALDDVAAVAQNTVLTPSSVTTPVLASDTVTPGAAPLNPASVTVTGAAAHGSTVVNPGTGAITYTPTVGYSGPDEYTYRVCDTSIPTPVCVSADVTVTVGTNAVAVNPDVATTAPTVPVTIDVRLNDSTSTGQPLANPTVTTPAGHGTTVVDPETGDIVYTPVNGFSGVDTFEYTVCDTSVPTPICAAADVVVTVPSPFLLVDDTATTTQNTPVTTDVLADDTITAGGAPLNPASVAVTVLAEHGTTTVDPETGAVTYTPAAGYSGPDSFTYRVCDASLPIPVCGSAVVTVTVGANTVTAVADTTTTLQDAPTAIDVVGNDTVSPGGAPLDPASVTVPTGPTHGTVTVDPATGTITYTPTDGYSGPDSFTYRVCDASTPTPVCGTATVELSVLRTGLTFAKSASVADTDGDGVVSVGDTISYRFAVSNDGEVAVSGIVVVDPTAGQTSCPQDTLAPGEAMECVALTGHVITDADAASGGVTNSAYVRGAGLCPDGSCTVSAELRSAAATVVTPISGDAQLSVSKAGQWIDSDGDGGADVGERVTWTIAVTNPGTAPVTDLAVSDPTAGPVTCADSTVAPGATVRCTVADTVLTVADLAAGSVTNVASATGTGPSGAIVSPAVSAVTSLPVAGKLSYTGFATTDTLWIALLLTALGVGLLVAGKRRRASKG